MSDITIRTKTGEEFGAYMALPKESDRPAPAIIVIQEIFGINEGIRGKCDWLASEGFIAIAPDLFWRLEPGVQLTDKTKEEWNKAFDLMNRFDIDSGIADLSASIDYARSLESCNGKVGDLGYCLGGKLAYLMAARTETDASVGYYGVGLDQLLDEAENIQSPLLLHIAELDKFSSDEAREKVVAAFADSDIVTTHVYKGCDHAFTRVGGEHYDVDAARTADSRSITFFNTHLKG